MTRKEQLQHMEEKFQGDFWAAVEFLITEEAWGLSEFEEADIVDIFNESFDNPVEENWKYLEDLIFGNEWFAVVGFGGAPLPDKGPFSSIEEADAAIEEFRKRFAEKSGTYLSAGNVRILAYRSRHDASEADISDQARIVNSVR